MDTSIEMITSDGKVFIPNLLLYSSVSCEKRDSFRCKYEYEIELTIYIKMFRFDDYCVEQQTENYYFDNEEKMNEYYEQIKEILKKKVEEKENASK